VWFHPSHTIARVAHENPGYRLFALPVIAGFAVWPTIAFFSPDADRVAAGVFWSSLLTFGPLLEILQIFLGAFLIRATGIWFGGRAGVSSIQTAIAWSNVPVAALAVLCIPVMIISVVLTDIVGVDLVSDPPAAILFTGVVLTVIQFAFVIWSVIIFVLALARLQGFSTGRAIMNTVAAWSFPAALLILVMIAAGHGDDLTWAFFSGYEELVRFDAK